MDDLSVDVLINKDNLLPSDYYPKSLIITDNNENNFHNYKNANLKPTVRADIYPYIQRMISDAEKSGIYFIVDSGYRSYFYQKVILEELVKKEGNIAYQKVAKPGSSEHQTGLAIDIAYYKNGVYSDDVKEYDDEAIWLANNSYKYGFILRYPKGKEDITGYQYEPWHFRFVGLDLAKKLYDEGITLEEYEKRKNIFGSR